MAWENSRLANVYPDYGFEAVMDEATGILMSAVEEKMQKAFDKYEQLEPGEHGTVMGWSAYDEVVTDFDRHGRRFFVKSGEKWTDLAMAWDFYVHHVLGSDGTKQQIADWMEGDRYEYAMRNV